MSSKEISPRVREIADALKVGASVDSDTGLAVLTAAPDVFAQYLATGITLDTVLQVHDAGIEYAEATTLAHGELQQDAMVKNPELQKGQTTVKFGHQTIETSYRRKASGVAMGKPWEKFGIATTDVLIASGRKKGGYNTVVGYLGDEAAKVFAN